MFDMERYQNIPLPQTKKLRMLRMQPTGCLRKKPKTKWKFLQLPSEELGQNKTLALQASVLHLLIFYVYYSAGVNTDSTVFTSLGPLNSRSIIVPSGPIRIIIGMPLNPYSFIGVSPVSII